MDSNLRSRRCSPHHQVGVSIAEQESRLKEYQARGPNVGRPTEPRQDLLGHDRLNQEQQKRADKDSGGVEGHGSNEERVATCRKRDAVAWNRNGAFYRSAETVAGTTRTSWKLSPISVILSNIAAATTPWSVSRFLAKIIHAVDRADFDLADVYALQYAQRDLAAGRTSSPNFAIKLGLRTHPFGAHGENDVPALHARAVRGSFRRHPVDDQAALNLICRHAEPRPRGSRAPACLDQVGKDRLQRVNRNEHIARQVRIAFGRVAHDERADAEQRAIGADQRGAAPIRGRRRCKNRPIEQILPAAGEGPARHDHGASRLVTSAMIDDQHRIAFGELARVAQLQRRDVERRDRLYQPETGAVVVANDARRTHMAFVVDDLDIVSLDDQIADGKNQAALADHHAGAFALGAERRRAACVGQRARLDGHYRSKERLGVDRWSFAARWVRCAHST